MPEFVYNSCSRWRWPISCLVLLCLGAWLTYRSTWAMRPSSMLCGFKRRCCYVICCVGHWSRYGICVPHSYSFYVIVQLYKSLFLNAVCVFSGIAALKTLIAALSPRWQMLSSHLALRKLTWASTCLRFGRLSWITNFCRPWLNVICTCVLLR
jgi:hypothetical protein